MEYNLHLFWIKCTIELVTFIPERSWWNNLLSEMTEKEKKGKKYQALSTVALVTGSSAGEKLLIIDATNQ